MVVCKLYVCDFWGCGKEFGKEKRFVEYKRMYIGEVWFFFLWNMFNLMVVLYLIWLNYLLVCMVKCNRYVFVCNINWYLKYGWICWFCFFCYVYFLFCYIIYYFVLFWYRCSCLMNVYFINSGFFWFVEIKCDDISINFLCWRIKLNFYDKNMFVDGFGMVFNVEFLFIL